MTATVYASAANAPADMSLAPGPDSSSGPASGSASGPAPGSTVPAATDTRAAHADRLARARAALGAAELAASRWGSGAAAGRAAPLPRPAIVPDAAPERSGEAFGLPVPLRPLLPAGLPMGSSVDVSGSRRLALEIAAAACESLRWCAVVAMPDLGMRTAFDVGLDPDLLALVPDPGERTGAALSSLIDGVGVVLLGPELRMNPRLARSLRDRARTREVLVISCDPPTARGGLRLQVTGSVWEGLGSGWGRLRSRRVTVTATGRALPGAGRSLDVLLPGASGRLEPVPAPVAEREDGAARREPTAEATTPPDEPQLQLLRGTA